jgi:hypothetical protein
LISARADQNNNADAGAAPLQAFNILDGEPAEFVSVRGIAVVAAALETRRDFA